MKLLAILLSVLALPTSALSFVGRGPAAATSPWQTAFVTSYATWEFGGNLDGCGHNGCFTACNRPYHKLKNWAPTVAVNYGIGLDNPNYGPNHTRRPACGTKVEFILWMEGRPELCNGMPKCLIRRQATVTDRTLSRYHFEFTYSLSRRFGAPDQHTGLQNLTWSSYISWRKL